MPVVVLPEEWQRIVSLSDITACLPQELIELALQSANDDLKAVAWACTWAMGTRSRVVSDIGLAGERSHREG